MDAGSLVFRTRYENLDIIPNARSVQEVFKEGSLASKFDRLDAPDKFTFFGRNLDRLRDFYDYIIIDGQPAMDSITKVTVAASDYVLSPISADIFNLQTVNETLNLIDHCNSLFDKKIAFLGFFLNNVKDIKETKNNPYIAIRNHYAESAKEYFIDAPVRYSESSEKSAIKRDLWLDYALKHTVTLPNPCRDLLHLMYKELLILEEEYKDNLIKLYGLKEKYFL